MALTNLIKTIQNIMRKDTGVDGDAQRISQLTWMLFLKIFDDKESEYELLDANYRSPIPQELRWRNWAKEDTGITGDDLVDFINDKLFPDLKNLSWQKGDDPRGFIVREIFQDSYNYMKSGTLMRQVINVIDNDIDFNKSEDTHLFNDIYEKILRDLQSAGNAGEYYTPRAVTQFIVEMINPKLGDKILDPACGTGGFLIDALEHIRKNEVTTPEEEKVLQDSIHGIEKKPLPHMLVMTNLILHGIDAPLNVRRGNSLSQSIRDITQKDRVDVILTNPPFGGQEQEMIKKGFPAQYQTSETADLFLVMIIELLKKGGSAGVVLPDGFLSGEGVKARVREKLLTECNLHTIVRLPASVFAPYTTVPTNILFFTKGKPTNNIWYYQHSLPKGQKAYSKTKPILYSEFEIIKKWWGSRIETENSWQVSKTELEKRNWDLDLKNPNLIKNEQEYSSQDLKPELEKLEYEISKISESILEQFDGNTERKSTFNDDVVLSGELLKTFKDSILEAAVLGDLTFRWRGRNRKVQPALDLLSEIGNIRYRNSRIKQVTRRISNEDKGNKLYNVPDTWAWCKLGDICDIQTGRKDANEGSVGGKYNFYTCAKEPLKSDEYSFDGEAILLPGNGANVGFSRYVNEKFEAYQRTYVLNNFVLVSTQYIAKALEALWAKNLGTQYGTAINYIKMGNVSDFMVPLPPVLEQIEIVNILKPIMRKIEELYLLDAEYKRIKQIYGRCIVRELFQIK